MFAYYHGSCSFHSLTLSLKLNIKCIYPLIELQRRCFIKKCILKNFSSPSCSLFVILIIKNSWNTFLHLSKSSLLLLLLWISFNYQFISHTFCCFDYSSKISISLFNALVNLLFGDFITYNYTNFLLVFGLYQWIQFYYLSRIFLFYSQL